MAIDAKVSFMGQVERKCADVLTVSEMEKTMQIISDVLEGFDMRECAGWKDEQKDDLMDAFLSTMAIHGRSDPRPRETGHNDAVRGAGSRNREGQLQEICVRFLDEMETTGKVGF